MKSGKDGKQYLYTYREQIKYMLDKTDKYLRIYENNLCKIKTGEEVKQETLEALESQKI